MEPVQLILLLLMLCNLKPFLIEKQEKQDFCGPGCVDKLFVLNCISVRLERKKARDDLSTQTDHGSHSTHLSTGNYSLIHDFK